MHALCASSVAAVPRKNILRSRRAAPLGGDEIRRPEDPWRQ